MDVAQESIKSKVEGDDVTLLVRSSSNAHLVAGSIVGELRKGYNVVVRSIGAGAVNQAIKGTIIARGYWNEEGRGPLTLDATFLNLYPDGGLEQKTAICLTVIVDKPAAP